MRFVIKALDHAFPVTVPSSSQTVTVGAPTKRRSRFPFTGFIDFQGIPVDVENRKGSVRSGKDADGHAWRVRMGSHYGEIRSTECAGAVGSDDDNLDVYVGDAADSPLVVVIHQHVPRADGTPGAYDEDKVMLGFNTVDEAVAAYVVQYDRPGFYREGDYEVLPIGAFWRWVHDEKKRGRKVRFSIRDMISKALAQMGLFGGEHVIRVGPRGGQVVHDEGGHVEYARKDAPIKFVVHVNEKAGALGAAVREFHAAQRAGGGGKSMAAALAALKAMRAGNMVEAIKHSAMAASLSGAWEKFNEAVHAVANHGLDLGGPEHGHQEARPVARGGTLALHGQAGGQQTRFVIRG
jgi:hypothetical protein